MAAAATTGPRDGLTKPGQVTMRPRAAKDGNGTPAWARGAALQLEDGAAICGRRRPTGAGGCGRGLPHRAPWSWERRVPSQGTAVGEGVSDATPSQGRVRLSHPVRRGPPIPPPSSAAAAHGPTRDVLRSTPPALTAPKSRCVSARRVDSAHRRGRRTRARPPSAHPLRRPAVATRDVLRSTQLPTAASGFDGTRGRTRRRRPCSPQRLAARCGIDAPRCDASVFRGRSRGRHRLGSRFRRFRWFRSLQKFVWPPSSRGQPCGALLYGPRGCHRAGLGRRTETIETCETLGQGDAARAHGPEIPTRLDAARRFRTSAWSAAASKATVLSPLRGGPRWPPATSCVQRSSRPQPQVSMAPAVGRGDGGLARRKDLPRRAGSTRLAATRRYFAAAGAGGTALVPGFAGFDGFGGYKSSCGRQVRVANRVAKVLCPVAGLGRRTETIETCETLGQGDAARAHGPEIPTRLGAARRFRASAWLADASKVTVLSPLCGGPRRPAVATRDVLRSTQLPTAASGFDGTRGRTR